MFGRADRIGLGVILVAALGWRIWSSRESDTGFSDAQTVVYQGENFRTVRPFFDYEDFQHSPERMAPEEFERMARAVREAKAPVRVSSDEQLIRMVFDLKFPGYGLGIHGRPPSEGGKVFCPVSVEVPEAGEYRMLVYEGTPGGVFVLLDDFLIPNGWQDDWPFETVKREEAGLAYYWRGRERLYRPLPDGR